MCRIEKTIFSRHLADYAQIWLSKLNYSELFSPNHKWLGALGNDQHAKLVDLPRPSLNIRDIKPKSVDGKFSNIVISPDNQWIATLDTEGRVSLHNLKDEKLEPLIPNIALNALASFTFNSDEINIRLAGGTTNGWILIWNMGDLLNDPNTLPIILQGGTRSYDQIAFTPDSNWIRARGENEDLKAWRVNFEDGSAFACRAAGLNLSMDEWVQSGFTEPYRKTCDTWALAPEITVTP